MSLRNKFQYVLVIGLIISSFSTGGAEDVTVESCELQVCKGREKEPCDPYSVPRDCYDIQQLCGDSICSGLYYIYPEINGEPLQVYCDMDIDGGGWLVFQRREDGRVDFYRGWNEYKAGFGSIAGEFWLGNEHLHKLTEHSRFELRVDLTDFDGERRYSTYDNFEIKSEGENYKLEINGYSGNANAGNSMSYHNGAQFSTKGADNDECSCDCAGVYKGAWWYKSCTASNLNGLYLSGPTDDTNGVWWYAWRRYYSLKETEMKIRPYGV